MKLWVISLICLCTVLVLKLDSFLQNPAPKDSHFSLRMIPPVHFFLNGCKFPELPAHSHFPSSLKGTLSATVLSPNTKSNYKIVILVSFSTNLFWCLAQVYYSNSFQLKSFPILAYQKCKSSNDLRLLL